MGEVRLTVEIDRPEDQLMPMKHDFKQLLREDSPLEKDVSLLCKDGATVQCHKFVLCARSQVFMAMLTNDATRESQEKEIMMDDLSTEVVNQLLEYLYTDTLPMGVSDDIVTDLLEISDKYNIGGLRYACDRRLCHNMPMEVQQFPMLLVFAYLHSAEGLLKVTMKRVCENLVECQNMEEWKQVLKHQELVDQLLKFALDCEKQ